MLLRLIIWLWMGVPAYAASALPSRTGLRLLQPLDGSTTSLNPSTIGTIDMLYAYFWMAQQWIFGVAAGFCILNVLIGGFMILNSGGDPNKRSSGVEKATWSVAGLLLLATVSMVLWFINPDFYI